MNKQATRHLSQAATFVAKGEEFYRKAADEIIAAQKADHSLSNRQIGEYIGDVVRGKAYSENWVRAIVSWSTSSQGTAELPFSEPQGAVAKRHTKAVLEKAPLEQVEQIIDSLPPERKQALAAAAGHSYHKARQDHDEREATLTSAERDERERLQDQITRPLREATAGFTAMSIATHLEQATDQLRELVADSSLSSKELRRIDDALSAFVTEFDFARAMAGGTEEA